MGNPSIAQINPKTELKGIDEKDPVSFIPMEAVTEKVNAFTHTQRSLSEVRKGYTCFQNDDVLWAKITPCMQNGKTAVVQGLTNGVGFGSTEFHVIRAKASCLSRFIWAVLSMPRLLYAAQGAFTGSSGHQRVPASFLEQLEIPVPPLDVQNRLVNELDAARVERDRAMVEAERLLGSIDSHVLAELAILPEADHRRVFAVRLAQAQPRLDADYHSPYFQRLRRAIELSRHANRNLGELTVFMRSGFAAGRQDQAHGHESAVPHLRPLNLNAWGELSITETKSVPASRVKDDDYLTHGEVLFNNTNSAEWVGKTAVFELDAPCACSNHMTRIALKPDVEPHFVAALLNAFRGIGYFSALSTFFNNQAGINTSTLAALRVPVPDFATQQAIAIEVVKQKKEARRLQDHAATIWQQARERFEQQLLKGDTA